MTDALPPLLLNLLKDRIGKDFGGLGKRQLTKKGGKEGLVSSFKDMHARNLGARTGPGKEVLY